MAVGNLEVLRGEMIGRVGAEVDCVDVSRLVSLSSGIIPTLRGDGVGAAVGRS